MANFLVIGGSGVMGTAAIRAVQKTFGKEANIVANWYGKEDTGLTIEHANHTLFGDITDPQCLADIKAKATSYEYLFYATALGEVGTPIHKASPEKIALSNRLSFDPLSMLEDALEVGTMVAYSTFYVTRHQLGSYGAMGYSKEAIEKWTLKRENPNMPVFVPVCLSRNPPAELNSCFAKAPSILKISKTR